MVPTEKHERACEDAEREHGFVRRGFSKSYATELVKAKCDEYVDGAYWGDRGLDLSDQSTRIKLMAQNIRLIPDGFILFRDRYNLPASIILEVTDTCGIENKLVKYSDLAWMIDCSHDPNFFVIEHSVNRCQFNVWSALDFIRAGIKARNGRRAILNIPSLLDMESALDMCREFLGSESEVACENNAYAP